MLFLYTHAIQCQALDLEGKKGGKQKRREKKATQKQRNKEGAYEANR